MDTPSAVRPDGHAETASADRLPQVLSLSAADQRFVTELLDRPPLPSATLERAHRRRAVLIRSDG